jgi:hypothetical protein
MLARKEWTRGNGTPRLVKGLVWFRDGSKMEGTWAGLYVQSVRRMFSIYLGERATIFRLIHMLFDMCSLNSI